MMYQACRRPGRKPRQQRARLMRPSALQTPRLTQTKGRVRCIWVYVWVGSGADGCLVGVRTAYGWEEHREEH